MEEEAVDTGPKRPTSVNFLKIKRPGKPVVLQWDAPPFEAAGYIVYATENRFPPNMAAPLFEGKMRQFVDEQKLDRGAAELRVARAENFYAVIAFDIDDNYAEVTSLREPDEAQEILVDIKPFKATQARTFTRARFVPGVIAMRDKEVQLFVRDIEPNAAALGRMASGQERPDFILKSSGDGFIDTITEPEWRKFYVAVAVGRDGVRRPQDLELGGFVRVEDPQYLEQEGPRKCAKLMEKVRDQLELELQRRSVSAAEMKKMLARADTLAPFNPMIERLKRKARERYGADW